jgi:predicted RecB family nuclease
MAQFILATETEDENERNARMGEILKYNEEDLAATWAVFEWLKNKGAVKKAAAFHVCQRATT